MLGTYRHEWAVENLPKKEIHAVLHLGLEMLPPEFAQVLQGHLVGIWFPSACIAPASQTSLELKNQELKYPVIGNERYATRYLPLNCRRK